MKTKHEYYRRSLEVIERVSKAGRKPRLLLHVCCGPCSTYPLSFLSPYFDVTVYFHNSNIYPFDEYEKRRTTLQDFIERFNAQEGYHVSLIVTPYDEESYAQELSQYHQVREGGERCLFCYRKRMSESYHYAATHGFAYFTTVMSVSRQKRSEAFNQIGEELARQYPTCQYLFSDFKKARGAEIGAELTREYHLYRQNYCGCRYSYAESLKRKTKDEDE